MWIFFFKPKEFKPDILDPIKTGKDAGQKDIPQKNDYDLKMLKRLKPVKSSNQSLNSHPMSIKEIQKVHKTTCKLLNDPSL